MSTDPRACYDCGRILPWSLPVEHDCSKAGQTPYSVMVGLSGGPARVVQHD